MKYRRVSACIFLYTICGGFSPLDITAYSDSNFNNLGSQSVIYFDFKQKYFGYISKKNLADGNMMTDLGGLISVVKTSKIIYIKDLPFISKSLNPLLDRWKVEDYICDAKYSNGITTVACKKKDRPNILKAHFRDNGSLIDFESPCDIGICRYQLSSKQALVLK